MYYRITDCESRRYYYATNEFGARDETDKSALQEAIRTGDTITMGKIIVTPEKYFHQEHIEDCYREDKKKRLLNGEKLICSDEDLDYFIQDVWMDYFIEKHLKSLPNPTQCGRLDKWVAWIEKKILAEVARPKTQEEKNQGNLRRLT